MICASHSFGVDIPMRRSDVEWVELDGEAVLYDPRAHTLHRLNASAATVWRACDGTAAPDQITRAIEDGYSGSRGSIAPDVSDVIAQFRRLGLLERPGEDAAAR
jgi:hypothetical protein